MDRTGSPSLLPIFRSQQQAELLALVLGDASVEHTLTELAARTRVAYASVHREIDRAVAAGLVTSRLVGRTRLIRADTTSPYFVGLSDVLVKAFGVPWVLGRALADVDGIDAAYIYGSWAARHEGVAGDRPVGDIDVLILGSPDRDRVYGVLAEVESTLARPVQVTIRAADWLRVGTGSFHDTVSARPMVPIAVDARSTTPAGSPPTPVARLRPRSAR